jgi:hypothetical protein
MTVVTGELLREALEPIRIELGQFLEHAYAGKPMTKDGLFAIVRAANGYIHLKYPRLIVTVKISAEGRANLDKLADGQAPARRAKRLPSSG